MSTNRVHTEALYQVARFAPDESTAKIAEVMNGMARRGYLLDRVNENATIMIFEHLCRPCIGEDPTEVHYHCNTQECPHFAASVPDQIPDGWQ